MPFCSCYIIFIFIENRRVIYVVNNIRSCQVCLDSSWTAYISKHSDITLQHTYGEEAEDDLVAEEAMQLTEAAIQDGSAQNVILPQEVEPAPEGAVVDLGGKKCKWCGSTSHSRKSHKDCPYNKQNTRHLFIYKYLYILYSCSSFSLQFTAFYNQLGEKYFNCWYTDTQGNVY